MKCVVWDLDETLWSATTLELSAGADLPRPDPAAIRTVQALRERGILNVIVTRNPPELATRLRAEGWADEFALVRSGWETKPTAVAAAAADLGVALRDIAYVDEDAFQRAYVGRALPEVWTLTREELDRDSALGKLEPVTDESRRRTAFYRDELERRAAASARGGSIDQFLRECGMVLTMREARIEDASRIAELVARTNQYNSTGPDWCQGEIVRRVSDPLARAMVAQLVDRFGDYGMIGAVFATPSAATWVVDLLILSCRTAGRGCTEAVISEAVGDARVAGLSALQIPVVATDRNAPLRVALRRLGLVPSVSDAGEILFEHDVSTALPPVPSWLTVVRS